MEMSHVPTLWLVCVCVGNSSKAQNWSMSSTVHDIARWPTYVEMHFCNLFGTKMTEHWYI